MQGEQMKTSPTLRPATSADAKRLSEIYLTSRKMYLPYAPLAHSDQAIEEWVLTTLIPKGGVTVATVENAIVGFLAVSHDQAYGWIDQIYLDPSFVGAGLGSVLLNAAKSQLKAPIRLYTFQQNEMARRFYRQHGFREIEFSDGVSNEEKTPDVLLEWP
jgi:GNAT superfamily N-acetyltransferase